MLERHSSEEYKKIIWSKQVVERSISRNENDGNYEVVYEVDGQQNNKDSGSARKDSRQHTKLGAT